MPDGIVAHFTASTTRWGTMAVLGCAVACGSEEPAAAPNPLPPGAVVTVEITAVTSDSLHALNDTTTLVAQVRVDGMVDASQPLTWQSRQAAVARSVGAGRFVAAGNGDAVLVAQSGSATDSVTLAVAQRTATVSVESMPDTVFSLGVRTRFAVTVRDLNGFGIPTSFALPAWTSTDPSVAIAESLGLALPVAGGTTRLVAAVGGISGQAGLTVVPDLALEVDPLLAQSLQWIIEDSMAAHPAIPGIQAAVLLPNGTMWRGVTGISDSAARLRMAERMPLGSTSKTVISALILQLADQGILTLDDTLGQWLPPFANVPPEVELRHLLNNSSGIFNYGNHPTIGDSILADLNRFWQPDEIVQRFVLAPLFPPGQQYTSSGTGYLLLGMVAEAATATAASQEFRTRFWAPLGLAAPFEGRDEQPTGPLATVWWPDASGSGVEDFNSLFLGPAIHSTRWMAGGIWTNAEDLARWGRAFFGGMLFSPGLMAEILTAILDPSGFIPGQVGAGLGVRKYNYLGREQWGHSGATSGANSLLVWDRQSGIVVAVQINASGVVHGSQHFRIVPALLQRALQ
jgi:D-alanyl-D-alanine carboxypeptidase